MHPFWYFSPLMVGIMHHLLLGLRPRVALFSMLSWVFNQAYLSIVLDLEA